MSLPIFKSQDKDLMLLQTNWSTQLNSVIGLPLSSSILIQNVSLVSGQNVINHRLGRKLIGWLVSRMRGSFVQIYDLQDTNQMNDLTLILNSSGICTVDLIVF